MGHTGSTKGQVEVITLGGVAFGLATFQPGWRWKTSLRPTAKTKSCEVPHLLYQIAGRITSRGHLESPVPFGRW